MTDAEADLLETLRLIAAVTSCQQDVLSLAYSSGLFCVLATKLAYVRKLCQDTINQYEGVADAGSQ